MKRTSISSEEQTRDGWPDLLPLEAAPLPDWPRDVFPEPVNAFVEALATSTETPIELPALMVLAALSAVACRRYWIRTKPDHTEPLVLWTCCGLPSGSRKSSVFSRATEPVVAWENEERRRIGEVRRAAEREAEIIADRKEGIHREVRKGALAMDEADSQIAELDAKLPIVPTIPQVIVEDITPEHVAVVMAENGECCALMSDEGGVFDTILGRYTHVPNLDVYLKAYSSSRLVVNRGSRPTIIMNNPRLVMGICPQPDVVRDVIRNPLFRGRGFTGRFLIALPISTVGYRDLDPSSMPKEVDEKYERVLQTLLSRPFSPRSILSMDAPAARRLIEFGRALEGDLKDDGFHAPLREWVCKLQGNVARIAGIFHVVRYAFDAPEDHSVSVEEMEAAIRLGEVLTDHARRAFDCAGAIPEYEDARKIVGWIELEQRPRFLRRKCHEAFRSRFPRVDRLRTAIKVLERHNYVRQLPRDSGPKGGRPKEAYDVNPRVLD